jgi:hypothetical protein
MIKSVNMQRRNDVDKGNCQQRVSERENHFEFNSRKSTLFHYQRSSIFRNYFIYITYDDGYGDI